MYHTYLLKSIKNGRYYTGSTRNLEKRLAEHNAGKSPYDRLNQPFVLLYSESFETRTEAVRRERYLKTGKGREELELLVAGL